MYWLLWYQMPFLCLTVNVIHVHCWLTDTGATVAAAKLTSFCLLSYRFIIAEQTSQRSATEIEPQRPSASDQSPPQPRTQETKRESKEARGRDGEREGGNPHKPSHVSARATCFTYETHLSPFNSHEIVQEEVIAKGDEEEVMWNGQRGHYRESLITPWLRLWSITPVKIHSHPWVDKSERRLSHLISPLCAWSLDRHGSVNLSTYAALARCTTEQTGCFRSL